jgi:DNA/RNA endonuclease G (NUC1)
MRQARVACRSAVHPIVTLLLFFIGLAGSIAAEVADPAGTRECSADLVATHNPSLAGKPDRLVCFEAYISNFTGLGPENDEKRPFGVPHWVIQKVMKAERAPESRKRPRSWFTVPALANQGIAPTDQSYRFSQKFRDAHPNWYDRGHLAQKYLAERLGETAGWFTHNVVNAVPQRGQFNRGPWLSLECFTGAWANRYKEVWVVSGPIFIGGRPSEWLRSDLNPGALAVAIPDSLFKIVFRKKSDGAWLALAFVYPQDDPGYRKGPWNHATHQTSIARIETLTGEEFLPNAPAAVSGIKKEPSPSLWAVSTSDFDPGCKRFAKDLP